MSDAMSDVLIDKRGPVLWLTINRPEQRNALTSDVLGALTGALRGAKDDPSLRAIVITGAGDRAFCAGGDLKSAASKDGSAFHAPQGVVENALATFYAEVERCTLPLVARVNGHAMGGGLGLVAACDLAVAADDVLFATPEVKVGLYPLLITTYLMRIVPRRKLAEMALVGEPLDATRAVEYGIVNAAVPRAELDAKVDALVAALAERSPTAIRLGKHALHAVQDMTLPQCLEYMTLMLDRLAQTEDAREGFAAFTGKRKPVWIGTLTMADPQSKTQRTIRIGSCSGFWGDSLDGARQLVEDGAIDYLVGDYLAEITMSLLARAKLKDPTLGFTPDFVEAVSPLLPRIARQGIRVVVNAGGLNPGGCRAALAKAAEAAGVSLRIAVVEGDDLMPQQDAIRARAPTEMFSGASLPARIVSMNAYLGARPIAARARCRGAGRHHRALRRLGARAGTADARVRLAGHRLRPAVGGQPRGSPDRMRRAGRRGNLHRLGPGAGLGRHGFSDRRMPRGWIVRDHQARRHRRPRDAGVGLRADALRDRRPGCLPAARRRLRLDRRSPRAGRHRSGRRHRRERPRALDQLQGLRDVRRRLSLARHADDRRLRGCTPRAPAR